MVTLGKVQTCLTSIFAVILSHYCLVSRAGHFDYNIPNSLLQDFISRIPVQEASDRLNDGYYSDVSTIQENYRVRKNKIEEPLMSRFQIRDDILLPREPSPRKEYLEHSSLYGHQYMQGGAGEGQQHLKPDGSIPNIQVIKSDSVLPAYCNPPNPCPIGYNPDDGCIDEFVNTADFSKVYQSIQECMCDSEHMFNCPGNTKENELETLARSIQNEGVALDNTINKIMETMDKNHKVVAKKYFVKRADKKVSKRSVHTPEISKEKVSKKSPNPFLMGEKLPVVAKKSPHTAKL